MSQAVICRNSPGIFSGAFLRPDGSLLYLNKMRMKCKSWKCPDCSPGQVRILRSRIYNGQLPEVYDLKNPNACKFLTLTFPGKTHRMEYSPEEALKIMQECWNKLMTALRKRLGKIHYFRIVEPQKDGFPHFHVLLIGDNIAHRSIKDEIESLWRGRYGMGFIWMTASSKKISSFNHAINYATKYLTKGMKSIKKYSRIFSSSRGALMKKKKGDNELLFGRLMFGTVDDDGNVCETDVTEVVRHVGSYGDHAKFDAQKIIEILKEKGVA